MIRPSKGTLDHLMIQQGRLQALKDKIRGLVLK